MNFTHGTLEPGGSEDVMLVISDAIRPVNHTVICPVQIRSTWIVRKKSHERPMSNDDFITIAILSRSPFKSILRVYSTSNGRLLLAATSSTRPYKDGNSETQYTGKCFALSMKIDRDAHQLAVFDPYYATNMRGYDTHMKGRPAVAHAACGDTLRASP
jgi:hypothetical protein